MVGEKIAFVASDSQTELNAEVSVTTTRVSITADTHYTTDKRIIAFYTPG